MSFNYFALFVALIVGVFIVFMVIDCAKRKFKDANMKIVWLIVIVLGGIVGTFVYYFVVKRRPERW